jgi:2-isopropylmalate synthase
MLNVRKDVCGYFTGIKPAEIFNTSKMVSGFTGIIVQPNKAVVGENAFAHESGIHQDGMLKDKSTYEIMNPESVGVSNTKIILGRHSGKHGLKSRLVELGYNPAEEELRKVYELFLDLADKKKEIFDDDLITLMGGKVYKEKESVELDYLNITSGTETLPTATVKIKADGMIYRESSIGDGPVDACFNAIERALNIKPSLESYSVRSVTSGRQAMGEAIVRIRDGENSFSGRGVSTDIIEASAKAYLKAISQLHVFKGSELIFENDNLSVK